MKRIIGTYNRYLFSYSVIQEEIPPITSYEFREPEAKSNITSQKHVTESCVREVNYHSKDKTAALYLTH